MQTAKDLASSACKSNCKCVNEEKFESLEFDNKIHTIYYNWYFT